MTTICALPITYSLYLLIPSSDSCSDRNLADKLCQVPLSMGRAPQLDDEAKYAFSISRSGSFFLRSHFVGSTCCRGLKFNGPLYTVVLQHIIDKVRATVRPNAAAGDRLLQLSLPKYQEVFYCTTDDILGFDFQGCGIMGKFVNNCYLSP